MPLLGRRSVLAGAAALAVAGCARQTAVAAPQLDLSGLEARLGGRIGLSLEGPQQRLAWRGDERFTYCSTFKLFLATAFQQKVARGQADWDRQLPVTAQDMVEHAPVTGPAVGGQLSIADLCQAAVVLSDNPAANILIRELGGLEAFQQWYRAMGDQVTRVDRWETDLNIVDGDKDTTTPDQAVANLERIKPDVFRSHDGRFPRLLEWATNDRSPDRIRAGLPTGRGLTLVHKTGTGTAGLTHEIAYILPQGGGADEALKLALYYQPGTDASLEQREAVMAEATRMALAALGHG